MLVTYLLDEQLYCVYAQHLRPPMAALQDTLSLLHLLRLRGCIMPDNTLLYLSAVVSRVHDAADN